MYRILDRQEAVIIEAPTLLDLFQTPRLVPHIDAAWPTSLRMQCGAKAPRSMDIAMLTFCILVMDHMNPLTYTYVATRLVDIDDAFAENDIYRVCCLLAAVLAIFRVAQPDDDALLEGVLASCFY